MSTTSTPPGGEDDDEGKQRFAFFSAVSGAGLNPSELVHLLTLACSLARSLDFEPMLLLLPRGVK